MPIVDLGFFDTFFWSIDIAGLSPSIESTSGFSILPRNCRAYAERDSMYLLCPSAKTVLKAKELFPDPDTPVITTNLFLGISTLTSFKLFSLAPLTEIFSLEDIIKTY